MTAATKAEKALAKAQQQQEVHRQQIEAVCASYDGTPWEQSRTFDVVLNDGRMVRVDYRAPRSQRGSIHLQFHGEATSSSGYRSDFPNAPEGGYQGTPESFAKERAETLAVETTKYAVQHARKAKRLAAAGIKMI